METSTLMHMWAELTALRKREKEREKKEEKKEEGERIGEEREGELVNWLGV